MRLYSRRQLISVAFSSAVLVLLLAIGFGVIRVLPGTAAKPGAQQVSRSEPFALQTNHVRSDEVLTARSGNGLSESELENIRIYENRNQAVVNVSTETVSYNWFLEPVPRPGTSGSGSIIDNRGYILTNAHVVERAFKVHVTLADGDRYDGEVVGVDPENDLAVVRFDPQGRDLVTIPMGTSEDLRVGQKVLAIGNPFALDRTLTVGIVSGLGRPVRTSNDLVIRDMIQTDASINPGNSGGPLLDAGGRMIGINTVIYSPSGGSIGIGFAVPVDTARRVVPDLIEFGAVRRGWIDIVPRQLFPQLVQYAELPVEEGILISQVVSGGNAEAAGLRGGRRNQAVRYGSTVIYLGGDIITRVDGVATRSLANLYEALEDKRPGDEVRVVYLRGGAQRETTVVLAKRPEQFQWE
ncbi:MAG: PDZ domain-containing protein [Spirochaetaceae bacterium]|nr:MAG: PDZ domain-containing protein [Spirochaetaceae bacterium]